jgi:MFS family permease
LFWSKAAGLTGVVFSLISVKVIIKYGKLTIVRYAMIGMILSFIFTFSSSWTICLIHGIAFCLYTPVISLIGEYGGRDRAAAVSLYSFLLLAGASLGPLIAGIFSFHEILFHSQSFTA